LLVALSSATASLALAGEAEAAPVQATIYVSPAGRDCNPGTRAAPLQTLQAAQQMVRSLNASMTGDIDVVIEDGFYRLTAPLQLTPADSGNSGFRVVWTGAPMARPVVAGSVRITGWAPVADAGSNVWVAQGPTNLATRQLYVNGARAERAQGPLPVALTATNTGFTAASALMAGWLDPSGQPPSEVELVFKGGYGAWTELRCPIASMTGTSVVMVQPCWQNTYKRAPNWVDTTTFHLPPTSIENAYELLTKPGQWYLDTHSGRFYYIPNAGEDLATADVEAPVLGPSLVTGNGTPTSPIHDIVFQGIQFSYVTDLEPSGPDGFCEIQANYTITGNGGGQTQGLCDLVDGGTCPYAVWHQIQAGVSFTYDQNIQFLGDAFVHLGGAGLGLGNGSQNDVVQGNVVTDVSGSGIQIGNVDKPDATGADQTKSIQITDNHIFDLPAEFHGGIGLDIGYAKNMVVAHNQIDHTAYSGLSNGWGGWLDKIKRPGLPNFSSGNLIANNLIFDITTTMSEGAAIYTNGVQGTSLADGLVITGNVIHDLTNGVPHLLYTDNGSYAITVTNNAMYTDPNAVTSWGSRRVDYNYGPDSGVYSPFDVEYNYWDKPGDAGTSAAATIANNTTITSPSQVPAALVADAGLETPYMGLLNWMQAPLPADLDAGESDAPCIPQESGDSGVDAGGGSSSGAASSGGSSGSGSGSASSSGASGATSGSSGSGATTSPSSQSGCGCRVASREGSRGSMLLVGLGLLLARRRRKARFLSGKNDLASAPARS
jgi:MYXO-CTERM domain-containing protein